MSNDANYLDVENALKRVGGNVDLYKKLLRIFLEENNYDALCENIESGNKEETARLAHTIKGVSANLSLTNLRAVAANIEMESKAGNDCSSLAPELKETFEKTCDLVKDYLA